LEARTADEVLLPLLSVRGGTLRFGDGDPSAEPELVKPEPGPTPGGELERGEGFLDFFLLEKKERKETILRWYGGVVVVSTHQMR
jgi:hypothetical protein